MILHVKIISAAHFLQFLTEIHWLGKLRRLFLHEILITVILPTGFIVLSELVINEAKDLLLLGTANLIK